MSNIHVQQRLWVRMKSAGVGRGCPSLECRVGVGWGEAEALFRGETETFRGSQPDPEDRSYSTEAELQVWPHCPLLFQRQT